MAVIVGHYVIVGHLSLLDCLVSRTIESSLLIFLEL